MYIRFQTLLLLPLGGGGGERELNRSLNGCHDSLLLKRT